MAIKNEILDELLKDKIRRRFFPPKDCWGS